jgi:5'-AMP-activated protein kinase, catalytic alpha subunit
MNVVQLYDTVTSNRHLYLIMEYVEGGDLYEYINSRKQLSEGKACVLFQQLLAAVEYIHRLGVVHRDIKPENILMNTNHDWVKLVDFGLSNSYKNTDHVKTACGSPCYAAPEMLSGKPYYGLMSDIWSCGVVLFCMICGHLPFDDQNIKKLYRKITDGDYKIPSGLSPYAKDLISSILTTDPNKRITIEKLKKHPWMKLTTPHLDRGILIGKEDVVVDQEIVNKVKDLKVYRESEQINSESIELAVRRNNHNNITTAYYLLLQKKIMEEIERERERMKNKNLNSPFRSMSPTPLSITPKTQNISPIKSKSITPQLKQNILKSKQDKECLHVHQFNTIVTNDLNKTLLNVKDPSNSINLVLQTNPNDQTMNKTSEEEKKNNSNNPYFERSHYNTVNNVQTQHYIPTEINKSVNVVVINNIMTEMPKEKELVNQVNSQLSKLRNLNFTINKNLKLNQIDKKKFNLSFKLAKSTQSNQNTVNKLQNNQVEINVKKIKKLDENVKKSIIKTNTVNNNSSISKEKQTAKSLYTRYKTLIDNKLSRSIKPKSVFLNSINNSSICSNQGRAGEGGQGGQGETINKDKDLQTLTDTANNPIITQTGNEIDENTLPNSKRNTPVNNKQRTSSSLSKQANKPNNNNKFIFISPENSVLNLNTNSTVTNNRNKRNINTSLNPGKTLGTNSLMNNSISMKKSIHKSDVKVIMNMTNTSQNNDGVNYSYIKPITPVNQINQPKIMPPSTKHSSNTSTNYMNYQLFNQTLMKSKISRKVSNYNSRQESMNSTVNKEKYSTVNNSNYNNNKSYMGIIQKTKTRSTDYSQFNRLFDSESFNYDHSSIYQKNETSLNISNTLGGNLKSQKFSDTINKGLITSLKGTSMNKSNESHIMNYLSNPPKQTSVKPSNIITSAYKRNVSLQNKLMNMSSNKGEGGAVKYKPGFLKSNVLERKTPSDISRLLNYTSHKTQE